MKDFTINDITKTVLIVELNGNCHQVLLSADDKKALLLMACWMTDGLKISGELMPIKFETK